MPPTTGPGSGGAERVVGRIVKPHGVRGEVVVELRTDVPEHRFADGATLRLSPRRAETRVVTVASARRHGERLLVRFAGVEGADAAEELRGGVLRADPGSAPPTRDPDEFYDHQLEGLAVRVVDGVEVGVVRAVAHGAGGDLLVVDTPHRVGETMIPFVRDIVTDVDLTAGVVTVDPPEGLLDL